jgi:hypothetical protein
LAFQGLCHFARPYWVTIGKLSKTRFLAKRRGTLRSSVIAQYRALAH